MNNKKTLKEAVIRLERDYPCAMDSTKFVLMVCDNGEGLTSGTVQGNVIDVDIMLSNCLMQYINCYLEYIGAEEDELVTILEQFQHYFKESVGEVTKTLRHGRAFNSRELETRLNASLIRQWKHRAETEER